MKEIMELKDMLLDELAHFGAKGDLTMSDLEVVDMLAHAAKNLCKILDCGSSYHLKTTKRKPHYSDDFTEQMQALMTEAPSDEIRQRMAEMMQEFGM